MQLRKSHGQVPQQAELETETAVVVQAVCATKLPTLTFRDVARLSGLIADIFPGGHGQWKFTLQTLQMVLPVKSACSYNEPSGAPHAKWMPMSTYAMLLDVAAACWCCRCHAQRLD